MNDHYQNGSGSGHGHGQGGSSQQQPSHSHIQAGHPQAQHPNASTYNGYFPVYGGMPPTSAVQAQQSTSAYSAHWGQEGGAHSLMASMQPFHRASDPYAYGQQVEQGSAQQQYHQQLHQQHSFHARQTQSVGQALPTSGAMHGSVPANSYSLPQYQGSIGSIPRMNSMPQPSREPQLPQFENPFQHDSQQPLHHPQQQQQQQQQPVAHAYPSPSRPTSFSHQSYPAYGYAYAMGNNANQHGGDGTSEFYPPVMAQPVFPNNTNSSNVARSGYRSFANSSISGNAPPAPEAEASASAAAAAAEAAIAACAQQPTYSGFIKTTADALKLLAATDLPDNTPNNPPRRIVRRLLDSERTSLIRSGSVFVWDEKEAGMRRWTDGRLWSASRVSGCFLTYRELNIRKQ